MSDKKDHTILFVIFISQILVGCNGNPPQYVAYHENAEFKGCRNHLDGSRKGYHSAGTSIWVSDCDRPLKREYWRVFHHASGAYMIPRPDSGPTVKAACEKLESWIKPLFDKYALCSDGLSREQVGIFNSMPVQDALFLSHFLHSKLRFRVREGRVWPYPIPEDVLLACNTQRMSMKFQQVCEKYREIYGDCDGKAVETAEDSRAPVLDCIITVGPGNPRPRTLARRLNELYGVK